MSSLQPDDIVETVESAAENAGRYARKLFKETPNVATGTETLTNAIRAEPVKSAAIALGVGYLLAMIFRRR